MKTYLVTIMIVLIGSMAQAQYAGDKSFSEIDVDYLEILESQRMLSSKIAVRIDYGQSRKLLFEDLDILRDKTGSPILFNSMIDCLNYMSTQGYEFVSVVQNADPQLIRKGYLLKRKPKL